jgi:hypothetical protein
VDEVMVDLVPPESRSEVRKALERVGAAQGIRARQPTVQLAGLSLGEVLEPADQRDEHRVDMGRWGVVLHQW